MTAMTVQEWTSTSVQRVTLADGMLVRLDGELVDDAAVDNLREALLRPLPAGCKDVIVDAGNVTAVNDSAIAVLLAGSDWARSARRRFALSNSSPALDEALRVVRMEDELPRLGRPTRVAVVPQQREG